MLMLFQSRVVVAKCWAPGEALKSLIADNALKFEWFKIIS